MKPSGHDDLVSSNSGQVKWKARKVSAIRDFPESFQPAQMDSSKNDHKHSCSDDTEEDSDTESVPLVSEQMSGQADQEVKEPLTYEDAVCESEESLMKMQPSGHDDLASSNSGQFKWKARKEKIVNRSENDIDDDIQSKDSSKNDHKHSFPNDPEEDSHRLESVPLVSEQISGQADQEIKEPLTYEDDGCESEESLMNSEILALIEDVEVKSDRLESVPKVSEQIIGEVDQKIKEPLAYESDDSLMNSEILALIEDVEVKSDRLESVPKVSEQIIGEVDREIKGPLAYESDDSLMNSEILALIEDVEVKSDRLVSIPSVLEQISGEVDQEINGPQTYESDDSLMNSQILALIEDVEAKSDGVNESEDSLMNSEILAMIEDVEVESKGVSRLAYDQKEGVKKKVTDLTGLSSSKALKVPKIRVSAVRCFPPGCGIKAERLSEEEFEKAIAESKNHCSSCCCTEPEEPFVEDEESEQEDEGKEKKSSERS